MRTRYVPLLLIASLLSFATLAQNSSSDFKIIGYYSFNSAIKKDVSQVPFDKLTHIDLAFVNPDDSGNFTQNFEGLKPFIEEAHRHEVKVMYSIGGGSYQAQYHELLKPANRKKLINNLIEKVVDFDVDGVDVDLESGYAFGPNLDPNYGVFIIELAQALRTHNKLITAALPSRPGNTVTHDVLSKFDFINIMSYDHTGPWSPHRPGHHASYTDAIDDIAYYQNTLKISKDKLVLGVPFYGHGFGPGLDDPVIPWMTYKEIVSTYAGSEWVDHWHFPNGYIMYYNGIPTIQNKTKLAKKEAAGIMIWELEYDIPDGKKSLLNAIYREARK